MPQGGARARSGPPPDPNALRRDRPSDQAGWLTLPAPRTDPAPDWPLTESTKREDAMWVRLWATPQAVMWEAMGLKDEVALYVRSFCEASQLEAGAPARTLTLRQMEGLGLSAAGMSRLRWRMPAADPEPVKSKVSEPARRTTKSALLDLIDGKAS